MPNPINALQATIKAAQQVQTMARLLGNNGGSAIVTAFKQQTASMGDHRSSMLSYRLDFPFIRILFL